MNASFTFPRPQAPVPRPAPASNTSGGPTRESNALRASVLNAALEIGLVSNPLVADWMFNNSLPEENEEEAQVSSPALTYAASEDSSSSALTPSSSTHSSGSSTHPSPFGAGAQFSVENSWPPAKKDDVVRTAGLEIRGNSQDTGISVPYTVIPFAEPRVPTPSGTRKLKKPRADGYDSDGGYMSESGKKKSKKEKKKTSQKDGTMETEKDAKKRAAKEEKRELEEERKRKKSLLSAAKASKKAESKSRVDSTEGVGYETDGAGYQSSGVKKTKSGFFNKLSGKSSRTDLRAEVQPVPALPPASEMEPVPLPIAERFATSISTAASSPTSPVDPTPTPVLGLPAPLPLLSFQPFTTATSEPPTSSARALAAAAAPSPVNRASHSSAGSSSSSDSKAHSAQFPPNRDTGSVNGHGNDTGSLSTITSSSHQHHSSQHMPNHNSSLVSPNTPGSLTQHDHPGPGPGSLKPPATHPNSRSPSPATIISPVATSPPASYPSVAPLQIAKALRMRPSFENSIPSSKNGPSALSPVSPFVQPSTLRSTASSPALVHPGSYFSPQNPMSAYLPRSHQNSSNPSLHPIISPPNTAINDQTQRPTQLTIVPSTNHIVPSPRDSSLTSPNVLAYYDIPPPSPPPMGPLPRVPAGGRPGTANSTTNANVLPSPAALRQRLIDRTARQLPPPATVHPPSNIQRGREPPFPARPILAAPPTSAPGMSGPTPGLEMRGPPARRYGNAPVPPGPVPRRGGGGGGSAPADAYANSRYQEEKDRAYAQRGLGGPGGPGPRHPPRRRSWVEKGRREGSVDDHDDDDYSAAPELRDVLDRFDDGSAESAGSYYSEPGRVALGRSRSAEARNRNQRHHDSFEVMDYYGSSDGHGDDDDGVNNSSREGEYGLDDDGGSVYSRESILDEGESGVTRDRLVKRVEEMLMDSEARRNHLNGGMGRGYVPPVQRLPNAFAINANMGGGATPRSNAGIQAEATPGRSWNKF